jgi:hypothetical protein
LLLREACEWRTRAGERCDCKEQGRLRTHLVDLALIVAWQKLLGLDERLPKLDERNLCLCELFGAQRVCLEALRDLWSFKQRAKEVSPTCFTKADATSALSVGGGPPHHSMSS